jgi:GNAT superfamily N-acetyltransferase
MGKSAGEIERAIEVFVRGFAFTRSFKHAYVPQRVGPLWMTRDAPRRSGDYRNEEYVAYRIPPAEAHKIAYQHKVGRFFICYLCDEDEDQTPIRDEFRRLRYRLLHTEPFFLHRLTRVPRFTTKYSIEQVRTQELADRLAKAARGRQIMPEHLNGEMKDGCGMRQYVAVDGEHILGWVRSIMVHGSSWVSNMYVAPQYRRRGIGRSMLARMLRDDRLAGMKQSVLLASHTGAMLYPVVGYEQIGVLLVYAPPKK